MDTDVNSLFSTLFKAYGPQGWWPVASRALAEGFDAMGYHPGNYRVPESEADRWEILAGAVLAQNTAWTNAERALGKLRAAGIDSPETLLERTGAATSANGTGLDDLACLIRSAGYYNQKSRRLETLARFMSRRQGCGAPPGRDELLSLDGIGPETADSMLLYAWQCPSFVVDAYTIRLCTRMGLVERDKMPCQASKRYEYVQYFITSRLKTDEKTIINLYSEYHALIVRHAKEHCRAKPVCADCPLEQRCPKMIY
jgi:endonuclease-3 related protein